MKLSTALRIGDGEVVAFVGGGGKSTAMFRLAEEIVEAGGRVITTTTTRIFAAQINLAPAHFSAFEASRARVEAALERQPHVLLTGPVDTQAGKASGVTLGLIEDLRFIPDVAAILIEADGSRMRPFKAPAGHEPVIPELATLVVPVVGADVLGQPLTDERVHRVELVCALAGARPGDPVTPELVARVIHHPDGGLKSVPASARVVPLLNKVEPPEVMALARQAAQALLRHERLAGVALGAVQRRKDPVREMHGRVAAVVLAAGRSTRMGRSKQLMPWGEGIMLETVVRRLMQSGVHEVVVVTGADRAEVEAALAGLTAAGLEPRVRLVFNPDYETTEMAASLQAGLRGLPESCQAAVVALGDQPQVEPGVVQAVIQRWRETLAPAVAPFHRGQRGHPLLLDRAAWPAMLRLPADAQPRQALAAAGPVEAVAVDSDSILRDIDTPEDYARESARSPFA